MIKVALSGINGRMGQMLLKAVLAAPDMELSAALGHSGSSAIGKDAGVSSGITTGGLAAIFANVLIRVKEDKTE